MDNNTNGILKYGVLSLTGVLVVSGFLIPAIRGDPKGAGGFGDMFGVVNALFSGRGCSMRC